jgi:M6 family metalloprotease-like protein
MLIPSFGPVGTLKILVFLVKFSDDDFLAPPITDPWPLNMNYMPPWGPTLVSSTVQSDYPDPSLSGYFQDMSLNQFNVIGDVYFYEPQFNQSYYYPSSGRHLGYLVEEILLHFDNQINYSDYDNWSGTLNQPDGFVDMIKICFRNAHIAQLDPPSYQGIARLTGWKGKFGSLPSNVPLELDGVKIRPTSSGTINNGVFDPHYGLPVMAHELGHYLFGFVHYTGVGFHGLMDGWGTGVMSSFERAKLGWIIPIPFETDATDAIIPDAITTGVVRKINIPNSNNYFLIDNHQRISFYELSWLQLYDGPLVSPGTGVLITHCTPYSIDVESAFGRWDWKKENGLYVYPFEKETVNRISGEDKLDLKGKNTTSGGKSHPDKLGSLQDFFNIGYNQLFSPWSNPSTYPDDSKIAIELLQIDQYKNAHLNIYLQDAYLAPPSKPQNLKVILPLKSTQ